MFSREMESVMIKKITYTFAVLIAVFVCKVFSQTADTTVLKEGLYIQVPRHNGNDIITPDAIEASIVSGNWSVPHQGQSVKVDSSTMEKWEKISTESGGWIRDTSLRRAYVYFNYKSDKDEFALLEAMGNSMVYVNGVPRSGNPYADRDVYDAWAPKFNYSLIPVKLNAGNNSLLFKCMRGYLKVKLHLDQNGLILNKKDLTIPDLILNKPEDSYGGIPIINASENDYKDLQLKTWTNSSAPAYYPVRELNPLSVLKSPFYIKVPAQSNNDSVTLNIQLVKKSGSKESVLANSTIKLKVVNPGNSFRETFISKLDGSVQYYAVNPPIDLQGKPALFLSLHGAGVLALNQANAYYHKNWGYIVCPTNRRPYGYDWENWGMKDGLEVLSITKKEFNVDTNRIYLTGHSMGGHGAWQFGVNFPDLFGAVGPSAGWISFWSYWIPAVTDSTPVRKMLVRSSKQSDTYALATNLKPDGVYIIQGADDDNVPPSQAESMVKVLSKFHKDFIFYLQPGANHWWDISDEPGADCVDWLPLFDFFAHHAVASMNRVKMVDYTTANLAVSYKDDWIAIINQIEQQKLSHVNFKLEAGKREFIGTTSNVKLLSINTSMLPQNAPVSVLIDNQLIDEADIGENNQVLLQNNNGTWKVVDKINEQDKYPLRCGNIREVLDHDVVFVYGTHGTKLENEWAFNKARYDAERIWYQGNGGIEVIKDDEFNAEKYKDRSVVLFGNSNTNSAWNSLLKSSPVQVKDDEIKAGATVYKGSDLACLMIRPREDSKVASVAVISGSGYKGMELADLADYFASYVNLPDIVVYNSGILNSDDNGVKFTGYFGNDWSVKNGDFVINTNK
jgi:dienelactone hydrolase